ncbi:hypothetical protein ACTFIY_005068 [Dictyostelium cf. discoideum]
MFELVHKYVIKSIIDLKIEDFLNEWMGKLKYHHSTSVHHCKGIFDSSHFGIDGTVIGIPLKIETLKQIITKLTRLKICLTKKKKITHFDILKLLEPSIYIKYKPISSDESISILNKFLKLRESKEIENSNLLKISTCSMNDSKIILKSRSIDNTLNIQSDLFNGQYRPNLISSQISSIIEGYPNINQVLDDIKNKKSTLKLSDHQLETLLKDENFEKMDENEQGLVFSLIEKSSLRYLKLKGSSLIKFSIFKQFDLDSIPKIEFENCNNLNSFGDFIIFKPIYLFSLAVLKFKNCKMLSSISINAPNLEKLSVENSPIIDNIETLSPNLKSLNLNGSINNLLILESINNYINLVNLNISNISSSILNSKLHFYFTKLQHLTIENNEILKVVYFILPDVISINLQGCKNIIEIYYKENEIKNLKIENSNKFNSFQGFNYKIEKSLLFSESKIDDLNQIYLSSNREKDRLIKNSITNVPEF